MVQITGKYQHVADENFVEYLKAYGTGDDLSKAEVFAKSKPVIEIKENDGEWIMDVNNEGKSSVTKFKLNEPFDEVFPHGLTLKSVVKKEGDNFIFESETEGGTKTIRAYQFSDDGITVRMSGDKTPIVGIRKYKRI
ncbi:fatty acid-binding protein [Cephus cinctus]|uniref:Fatty acid-binding protein n=1 Tax=Cephus cinctus TaxID=211228 RepID=A0AAJ7C6Q5_CEPCN|nr:fatty acid-binding protein [Cephus cinctus]